MAWVAVEKNGAEYIYEHKPIRRRLTWAALGNVDVLYLPKGSIKKLIGRDLTWEDEAVELKEE